jgi:hypothetical protein
LPPSHAGDSSNRSSAHFFGCLRNFPLLSLCPLSPFSSFILAYN